MNELELLSPKALQTRETFVETRDSVLGKVQVADELGFAYLDGDIDFGATGAHEIYQCIKYIILTEYFSVPLDREFGMNYSMVDKPIPIAEAILSQEVAMKIALYEPRAQFREISFVRDMLIGKLSPTVKVVLLTTNELPSSVSPLGSISAIVGGPPGKVIEEVDLPGFYEALIEFARVPGPPGPAGPAATIEAGTTTTGAPGTNAEVSNSGNLSEAVFDFVIPEGEKGAPGQIWRGEYNPATTYQVDDAVSYNGSSYICTQITTGVAPTPDTASNLSPPLANTGSRGSIAQLSPSNQVNLWARGDNSWQTLPADVLGPASSLDGEIALFNGTTGKLLKRGSQPTFLVPVGSVIDFAGATAPAGWLFLFGQSLLRTGYASLFGVLGTTFGAVDGTHFSLPDLRGRTVAGKDDMGGTAASRLAISRSGTTAVSATITALSTTIDLCIGMIVVGTNIPAGAKIASIVSLTSITITPAATGAGTNVLRFGMVDGATLGANGGSQAQTLVLGEMPSHGHTITPNVNYGGSGLWTSGGAGGGVTQNTSATGGDTAHSNLQPTFILNKIIYAGV